MHSTDFEVLNGIAPHWDAESFQIGRGAFSGGIKYAHTARMQFSTKYWSPGLLIRGAAPAGSVTLGFSLTDSTRVRHEGQDLGQQQLGLVRGGDSLDFRTQGPCAMFIMCMATADVQLHAVALLGRSLDEITRGNRLNGKRSPLDRQWAVERLGLDALFDNPARLLAPRVASWAENKILDVLLSALTISGERHHVPGA